jgi:hypothetical protein
MTGFLHKIKSLARGTDTLRESPFASVRATQKWLQNLPGLSDYDVHHALVEGLERYNGDIRGDTITRIKILRQIEEAGLPLQEKIIAQYLGSYAANESSRHTLWRECHLFWDQLAVAYLPFLRLAVRGGDAGSISQFGTEIAAKGLRYFSLGMRWEYLRGRRPSESAWRRLHKIYRMTEMTGVVFGDVQIEGKKTSCARDYVMTMLFDLATPYAFRSEEIQAVLDILHGLKELPVPETNLRHGRHTHMIDLAGSGGPEKIEDRWVPGGRLRYLDMHGVVLELEERAKRGSPDGVLCRKLAKVIGRAGASRRGPRKPRFGEVKAIFGADAVMKVFDPQRGIMAPPEFINLRDESSKGMGFVLDEDRSLSSGSLLAIDREEGHGAWQLLAVRWSAMEEHHWLLGTEILSKYPKRVEIEWEAGEAGKESAVAIFLPLASITQGATSNLLLPSAAYSAERGVLLRQDDGTHYRLKLGAVVETHESLVRVEFDVLSRRASGTS